MTYYDKLSSRGQMSGNVLGGLRECAFVTTQTHSQWTTPAWGVTKDLVVILDGGAHTQTLSLSPSTTYSIDDLVSAINALFVGVGRVAQQYRAGRLLLCSLTKGIDSQIDVSTSDQEVLDLLRFGALTAQGRTLEDAPESVGVENNLPKTRLVGSTEQMIRENINRPALAIAKELNILSAIAQGDKVYARSREVQASEKKTAHELGAPLVVALTSISTAPQVGETITGVSSSVTGVVLNRNGSTLIVAPPGGGFVGDFTPGETLNGSVSGAGFAVLGTATKDERIVAIKLKGRAFVGSAALFGTSSPTARDLESLFSLEVDGEGSTRNTGISSSVGDPTYGGHPLRRGERSRIRYVCLGEPDDYIEPSNIYNFAGVTRQGSVAVSSWTKTRIYPATFSANVKEGDICVVAGSVSSGLTLNNGNYRVVSVNSTEEYYEVGPVQPGLATTPEDTLEDPQIYADNGVSGVTITVYSPSYLLEESRVDSSAQDTTGWVLLERPAQESSTIVFTDYEVSNEVVRRAGQKDRESVRDRQIQAQFEDLQLRLAQANFGTSAKNELNSDTGGYDTGVLRGAVSVRGLTPDIADLDDNTKMVISSPVRQHHFYKEDDPQAATSHSEPVHRSAVVPARTTVGASHVGPVDNTHHRVGRFSLALFTYSSRSAKPSERATLTGAGGAQLTYFADQINIGATTFLASFASGSVPHIDGETFSFSGGTLSGVTFVRYVGFRLDMPYSTSGSTLTGVKGATSLTYTGTPTKMDRVRAGDLLWDFGASVPNKPRIKSIDTGTKTITLQEPLAYDVSSTEWGVLPGIGSTDVMGYNSGAYARKGSKYFNLYKASPTIPNLKTAAITVGDAICVTTTPGGVTTDGTGQSYLPIAKVVRKDTVDGRYLIEVPDEYAHDIEAASDVAWRIQTRHQKTSVIPRGSADFTDYAEIAFDTPSQPDRWLLQGPAYWYLPATQYGTPNLGGPLGTSTAGVSRTGLSGRKLKLELRDSGVLLAEAEITYASNPATLAALVTATQSLLTAASVDWAVCVGALGRPGVIFHSVGLESYTDTTLPAYAGIGPGKSLTLSGDALDAMLGGLPNVERGNLWLDLEAEAIHEEYCAVLLKDLPTAVFAFDGLITFSRTVSEHGRPRGYAAAVYAEHRDNESLLADSGVGQEGTFVGDDRPSTTYIAERYGEGTHARIALSTQAGGITTSKLTHDGKLFAQNISGLPLDSEGAARGADLFGGTGLRPERLFTGPLFFPVKEDNSAGSSLNGHVITLLIGRPDPTTKKTVITEVRIDFGDTTLTLVQAATLAQTRLTSASITWVKCNVDDAGTGLCFYVDESALSSDDLPFYHGRTFIYVDPRGTTLVDVYPRTQDWQRKVEHSFFYYKNVEAGQKSVAPGISSLTSGAHTAGVEGGLVRNVAGGRRLISPLSGNKSTTVEQASQESVVWDEVITSLKAFMDPPGQSTGGVETGQGYLHEESMLVSAGTKDPDKLFVFATSFGTPFEHGERVTITGVPGGAGVHYATLIDPMASQWYGKSYKAGENSPGFHPQGYKVQLSDTLVAPEGIHAGGARLVGLSSGAHGLINPLAIRVTDEVNIPSWAIGDQIDGQLDYGSVVGYYGGTVSFTLGSVTHKWYLLYGCTSQLGDTGTVAQKHTMAFQLSSTTHGTYSAIIEQALELNSVVFGHGNKKPIVAYSTKSFNRNDGELGKPAVHSFGDFTVPHGGDYTFRDEVPAWAYGKELPLQLTLSSVSGPFTVGERVEATHASDWRMKKYGLVIADLGSDVWSIKQVGGPPFMPGDSIAGDDSGETATVDAITTADSHFAAAKGQPQGRAFTVEKLAEDGRAIDAYDGGNILYPRVHNGTVGLLQRTLTDTEMTAPLTLREKAGYDRGLSPHNIVWQAGASGFPGESDQHYGTITFHPQVPDGFVWLEGFGAYIRHEYVDTRYPAIVSLHVVGGQGKEGVFPFWRAQGSVGSAGHLINDGYIHRLEVYETQGSMIRVDSAGAGGHDRVINTNWIPPWASSGETPSWYPFRPIPLLPHNERMIELFVECSEDTEVPVIGSPIYAQNEASQLLPLPYQRAGTIVYVEQYGEGLLSAGPTYTPNVTGYRLFVYLGPSSGTADGGFQRGFPMDSGWSAGARAIPKINPIEHETPYIHTYPWNLFYLGEKVTWTSAGEADIEGTVRYIQRYPHGMNVRIKVHLVASQLDLSTQEDECAGVFLRYRTDRLNLSQL